MNRISLDELLKKADSRYSLVVATAKRARELTDMQELEDEKTTGRKVVSAALEEIASGKIEISYPK
ncbi:DNA-directed RNA polymerase subunit omega [Desulfohalotomaculum tongense]|uniref:DNA-directed RNA polymerase subunit omega n=1 Tax=Desulforadius tongensis TaxID=1216062 RepID=UPI0019579C62|nr:DNA-directed RNA polymerase subunit omega [Desulforadius tongensis]MBM7855736.1 DNA-directed RNA polymerase subunit omega [Desulforadius tongensis]